MLTLATSSAPAARSFAIANASSGVTESPIVSEPTVVRMRSPVS